MNYTSCVRVAHDRDLESSARCALKPSRRARAAQALLSQFTVVVVVVVVVVAVAAVAVRVVCVCVCVCVYCFVF